MILLSSQLIQQLNERLSAAQSTIAEQQGELNSAAYLRGLHKGESQILRDEIKELREINRVLLDRVAGQNGFGPLFSKPDPATSASTEPIPFSHTPTEFIRMADEMERKALRDFQRSKLEELARERAQDIPKEELKHETVTA